MTDGAGKTNITKLEKSYDPLCGSLILIGEMTLVVSHNNTVEVSGPSRLVRSEEVHNTVSSKHQR